MQDRFSIIIDGQIHEAHRYLRDDDGMTYQTLFYRAAMRCDPAGHTRFTDDDPAMNAAAEAILAVIVDEAARKIR